MAALLTAAAMKHAVAHDLFPGDTYKVSWWRNDVKSGRPFVKVFVWDVLDNGTDVRQRRAAAAMGEAD